MGGNAGKSSRACFNVAEAALVKPIKLSRMDTHGGKRCMIDDIKLNVVRSEIPHWHQIAAVQGSSQGVFPLDGGKHRIGGCE